MRLYRAGSSFLEGHLPVMGSSSMYSAEHSFLVGLCWLGVVADCIATQLSSRSQLKDNS